MNRLGLPAGFLMLAAIGGGFAYHVVRRNPPAYQASTGPGTSVDLGHILDPANLGSIVFVNDSGKPCMLTLGAVGEGSTSSFGSQLPEDPRPMGPVKTTAPFAINKVTLEREGKKVEIDLKLTVGPGETYEVHVAPDNTLKAIATTPTKKPAP